MSTAQQLLRQFYGLEKPDLQKEARDINSPRFDAGLYYEEVANSESLLNLLTLQSSVTSEMQQCNSELQSIVYDNTSKFLNASATVHQFRQQLPNLKDHLDELRRSMSEVKNRSEEVCSHLDENRGKIQRLSGMSRLLERVEFISHLPEQLQELLDNEKYAEAAAIWTRVEPILVSQSEYPSFSRIHTACASIVDEIKSQTRGQMLNTDVTVEDSVTYAVLLIRLKTPPTMVCSQLTHHRFLVIDNILEYGDIPLEPFEILNALNDLVIKDIKEFQELYTEHLMTGEEKRKLESILRDFSDSTFDRIIQCIPIQSLNLLEALKVGSFVCSFVDLVKSMVNPQKLTHYIRNILQKYTEHRAKSVFASFQESIASNFDVAIDTLHLTVVKLVNEFTQLADMDFNEVPQFLVQQLSLVFMMVVDFLKQSPPDRGLTNSALLTYLSDRGLHELCTHLATLNSGQPLADIERQLSAQCARASQECMQRYIRWERQCFDKIILSNQLNAIGEPTEVSDLCLQLVNRLTELFKEASTLSAHMYERIGTDQTVIRSHRTPYNSTQFYGMSQGPTFTGKREEGYISIERMFMSVNRLHLSRPVGMDPVAILGALLNGVIKSMMEVIRNGLLSKEEFHQVQIDVFYIYTYFSDKMDMQDVFNALIEEVIVSAAERCIDPQPLDQVALALIYDRMGVSSSFP